jgi:hypothetical protein
MSAKKEIIDNIINEKTSVSSIPKPRNLTTTNLFELSSDSEDEDDFNRVSLYHRPEGIPDGSIPSGPKKDNWKQQMIDLYGPVHGPLRISRTPFIINKK